MPLYSYLCATCGKQADSFANVVDRHSNAPNCHGKMQLEIVAAMISPDIAPYRAVGGDMAGKVITSRRAHREFLKRNGFVEVGNEPMKSIRNDCRPEKGAVAKELKEVIPQVLRRHS